LRVLISRAAAVAIFTEVRRWVEFGIQTGGAPLESLVYPLSAMVPAPGKPPLSPLELVGLEQVAELVIDQVAIPPDAVKQFSPHNCHFSAVDIERANQEFNASIDEQLARWPRLAVLSKLHTHPFAGGAFLSGGDMYHGVTSPSARLWRRRRGLSTATLHVAYPDGEQALTSSAWRIDRGGVRAGTTRWRIHSWASSRGRMEELGDAEVVSVRHPSVVAARRRPYWATRSGGRWCDQQKAALREAGYRVSRNLLGRGWRRYLLDLAAGAQVVIALPPDLPVVSPRVLRVVNAFTDTFEPLPLPDRLCPGSLRRLSLLQLARHLGAAA